MAYNVDDYSADELRTAAQTRGLSQAGTKQELADRLNEYDAENAREVSLPTQDDAVGTDAQETDTVPDEYLTGAQKRAKVLDARREAERLDTESGGDTEMDRWHQVYGEGSQLSDEEKAAEASKLRQEQRDFSQLQRESTSGNTEEV